MSLYDDIGGNAAVNAAVDLFYEKVLADDRVNRFFADVDMPGQRGKQRKFLAYAFGAPTKYDGKDMRSAHADMKLTEEHFNAIAEHLRATMKDLNVPGQALDQLSYIDFDLVVAVGTTAVFAYIREPISRAQRHNSPTVEINPTETAISQDFEYCIRLVAADALQQIWSCMS